MKINSVHFLCFGRLDNFPRDDGGFVNAPATSFKITFSTRGDSWRVASCFWRPVHHRRGWRNSKSTTVVKWILKPRHVFGFWCFHNFQRHDAGVDALVGLRLFTNLFVFLLFGPTVYNNHGRWTIAEWIVTDFYYSCPFRNARRHHVRYPFHCRRMNSQTWASYRNYTEPHLFCPFCPFAPFCTFSAICFETGLTHRWRGEYQRVHFRILSHIPSSPFTNKKIECYWQEHKKKNKQTIRTSSSAEFFGSALAPSTAALDSTLADGKGSDWGGDDATLASWPSTSMGSADCFVIKIGNKLITRRTVTQCKPLNRFKF